MRSRQPHLAEPLIRAAKSVRETVSQKIQNAAQALRRLARRGRENEIATGDYYQSARARRGARRRLVRQERKARSFVTQGGEVTA